MCPPHAWPRVEGQSYPLRQRRREVGEPWAVKGKVSEAAYQAHVEESGGRAAAFRGEVQPA